MQDALPFRCITVIFASVAGALGSGLSTPVYKTQIGRDADRRVTQHRMYTRELRTAVIDDIETGMSTQLLSISCSIADSAVLAATQSRADQLGCDLSVLKCASREVRRGRVGKVADQEPAQVRPAGYVCCLLKLRDGCRSPDYCPCHWCHGIPARASIHS
ncbi:uncharacterized protein IWZ02DRAFT_177468 [Phyllosticta citriasiana]|uniref:uncharacterized protein n=1 Tax=Phyllosticta citriasiana TaxID=595635 RepID=UPI0030FDBE16